MNESPPGDRGGPRVVSPGAAGPDQPATTIPTDDGNPRTPKVTIPADQYRLLRTAAESWWHWWESGALADVVDREIAARMREASNAVAGMRQRWACGPAYTELEQRRFPWLHDPEWTPPMLAHRGGHYAGGPVDWHTGLPVEQSTAA